VFGDSFEKTAMTLDGVLKTIAMSKASKQRKAYYDSLRKAKGPLQRMKIRQNRNIFNTNLYSIAENAEGLYNNMINRASVGGKVNVKEMTTKDNYARSWIKHFIKEK
jgi:hypothetical protein